MNGWIGGSLYKANNRGFCEHYPPFLRFYGSFSPFLLHSSSELLFHVTNCAILYFLLPLLLKVLDHQTIARKQVVKIIIMVGGGNKGISSFFSFSPSCMYIICSLTLKENIAE